MAQATLNEVVELEDLSSTENLSLGGNLKIGLFHLGSGMADVLTTGVWNRIMVTDLGFAATPISLLVALRYFLAPLGVWAGRLSDERRIFGFRRMFWIGLGRALMVASTFILGFATAEIARTGVRGVATPLEWGMMVVSLLMFSVGSAISGTTFLALVYDRSPEHQRGRAVGVVWTFLLVGYTVAGILFGVLLPERVATDTSTTLPYSVNTLLTLFLIAGTVFGVVWFISMFGEEKRSTVPLQASNTSQATRSLRSDLLVVWQHPSLRFFMAYLSLSMFFAFSQDLILEPFAGDVFAMAAKVTSRFSSYWGTTAILGTIFFIWYSRRNKKLSNTVMSQAGMAILAVTFAVFALSSFAQIRQLVTPGLILLGLGLGIWNVGTLGLMMDLSPIGRAGTFLGFWTLVVTFSRGFGTSFGGIGRDVFLGMSGSLPVSYGMVFAIGAVGLAIGIYCLGRVNVRQFKRETHPEAATLLSAAMD